MTKSVPTVTLSAQQQAALTKVGSWKKSRSSPFFMLAGFAGTGKTTIAKLLAADVGDPVYFAAYTGKAAHVLRRTGLENACTIHQLIYTPRDKCEDHLRGLLHKRQKLATGIHVPDRDAKLALLDLEIARERQNLSRPEFTLNEESPLREARLLVVDEYSMIDERTGRDLLSFGCPVLALGDPGQLPPISGRCFFDRSPDVMLTEIHRQAAENPIIRMSKDVREGRSLRPGQYGSSHVIPRSTLDGVGLAKLISSADQLLVGMNKTRIHFNAEIRKMRGHESTLPEPGDRLVCLRNNHDERLINGQIFTVKRSKPGRFIQLWLESEDGQRTACVAHPDYFTGDPTKLLPGQKKTANEFDYGYALTVHKAQGSQWDKVLLIDEWYGRDRAKWLYTAITRTAESITVLC